MRRSLCVGIDEYRGGALRGCVSDAQRIAHVLQTNHDNSPNFDCRELIAPIGGPQDNVTRRILRRNIEELFKDPAEIALLHFSGHGTVNNLGGFLVTQDAESYDEGVAMSDVLELANRSAADEVVILLDCCYSGNLGNPPAFDNAHALLREGVSILTASRGDEESVEDAGGGVFTSLVVDALEGGATDLLGGVTAASIYSHVESALGAWDQRPLFKLHVSRLLTIRHCKPPIDKSILRDLPRIFPLPAEDFALDPSYEPKSEISSVENVKVFEKLQALNRVHLLTPIDVDHMYDAAVGSTGCRLTPTGRYYWRLANDGRI